MAAESSPVAESRADPASGIALRGTEVGHGNSRDVMSVINSIKKKISSDRMIYIKERIEDNRMKLQTIRQQAYNLSKFRGNSKLNYADIEMNLLTTKEGTIELSSLDKDSINCQEEISSSSVSTVGSFSGKSALKPVKIPEVEKIPTYSTWIFLDRNQRMSEDQSVVGRRRIYYDRSCGEALICSDSEDEAIEDDEQKKDFTTTEDYIIRMTIQETGLSDTALELLAQCLERTSDMIKDRYEVMSKEESDDCIKEDENDIYLGEGFFERDMDAAMDSFDNLFCRRCLVFDCRLHGCSQDLIFPCEKQPPLIHQEDKTPCGPHCYKLESKSDKLVETQGPSSKELTHLSDNARNTQSSTKLRRSSDKKKDDEDSEIASNTRTDSGSSGSSESKDKKSSEHSPSSPMKKANNKRAAECILASIKKRQKEHLPSDSNSDYRAPCTRSSRRQGFPQIDDVSVTKAENQSDPPSESNRKPMLTDANEGQGEEFAGEIVCKQSSIIKSWTVMEQGLFVKGLEVFGRNSCLVARNLLGGLKTCREVHDFINYVENNGESGFSDSSIIKALMEGNDSRARTRFFRRRGKVRRLKYTWKSAGYHFIRKRITEKKDQPCRQYTPCSCQSACGKQCTCILNGTCCEKYCGCSKICKNRFRGCHCAKSQCRSRQCPCFAADRECDPDVCKSCWVGCGDGSLGGPNQRGDNYECRNMKLLLKQQQRVLLGKSDVSGWGAFLKNSVGKHEYLGEYTGELISHREADKRGKIYDRENSSFLFNLNNQFVLDAQRMGDKLKFANHSPDPNCYAKVIMVAGDHRVGIFAKERIGSGEELFYDYRYEPDRAPAWARKNDPSGIRDDVQPSTGRAKKLA